MSIIDEFKSINNDSLFLNRVIKFDRLVNMSLLSAYKDIIFLECKNNKNVTQETIKLFKHLSNSYLMSNIVLNNFEETFLDYINNILLIKEQNINDIGAIFGDNEYIYLPQLKLEDIIYCFRYGDENNFYFPGQLNPTNIKKINLDENIPKEDYFIDLKKEFSKRIKNEEHLRKIENFISKIKILFDKFDNIHYNINIDWLLLPIEELKNESIKNPNKILIKHKYKNILNFESNIFDGEKIIAKALYASFEGSRKIQTIYKKLFINNIINNITNFNQNFDYGYRLMPFYNFHLYDDYPSKTMMLIISTVNEIISKLQNYINMEISDIIYKVYQEFIISIISSKSPIIEETKIIYIFKDLLYSFFKRYIFIYNEKEKELNINIKNKKENFLKVVTKIKKESIKKIDSKLNEYNDKIEKYIKDLNNLLQSEEYKKSLNKYYMKTQNIFGKIYHTFYQKINEEIIKNFHNSKEFLELKVRNNISEPYLDYKWERYKNNIILICEELYKIKNKEISNLIEINKIITSNEIKKNDYIEKNDYEQYNNLRKEFDSFVEQNEYLKNYHYSKLHIDNDNSTNIYDIQEENLEFMYNFITKLKSLSIDLFTIQKNSIKKKNFNIQSLDNIEFKQNSNYIFSKGNKPVFLNKYMKINLGLYILSSEFREIGSIKIQNNYFKELNYLIKQETNNSIIISNKSNRQLASFQDLTINFKLNVKNINIGFYESKFELSILDDKKECDKCIIFAFINIIPLIIKFSLPNQKFSLNNDIVSINHYIKTLKILYCFPGNYSPKSLGIELRSKNYYSLGVEKGNRQNKGEITIISKLKNINYELYLSLYSSLLLSFKVDYKKPKYCGLIIYDKKKIDINIIEILKTMTKDIYIFNMSYNKININLEYNKSEIDIDLNKNEIDAGSSIKLEIKNTNIINKTILRINGTNIQIGNKSFPKIQKYGCNSSCNFYNDLINFKNIKLFFIDNNFKLKKAKISDKDTFNFSTYLILSNKIIEEQISNYQFSEPFNYSKVYGFAKEKFGLFQFNVLEIALSFKITKFSSYKTLFSMEQRNSFKKNLEIYKKGILSNNINKINEAIGILINKKINIEDENSIKNLIISEDKISINNILIYLIKYSFKFESAEELKQNLSIIFLTIYYNSKRKIEKFFNVNIQIENLKIFLEKLSYIISFTILCVSPGEILEYEYKENIENNFLNEIYENEENINTKLLDQEFESYYKNKKDDNILDKDLIYHNGKISIHNENDEFSKLEKQIKEKDINVEDKIEEESNEFVKSCYSEIITINNDITENKINISNLLFFLENCKKYLMKTPFVLSKKENKNEFEACIIGSQMIYDYIKWLKQTNIMHTKFRGIIDNYFEELENFLSKFPYFHTNKQQNNVVKNESFEYTKKCELPFDDKYEIGPYKEKGEIIINNKQFIENKYLMERTEIELDTSEIPEIDIYESKKDLNFKESGEKYIIINKVQELSEEEKKNIAIEGIVGDIHNQNIVDQKQNMENKEKTVLKNDLTDFKEEIYEVNDIRKLYKDKNISTTIVLKDIMKIVTQKNQKYSYIKDIDLIKNLKINFDDSLNISNKEFYNAYSNASSLLQNIASNLIRKRLLIYNENEILPFSVFNSYLDILIDISQTMSEEQRIASLLVSTGLSISLSKYGVKIRMSVFGERDNVWLLFDDFSSDNIIIQLSRLRDALSCLKRIQSFPADALKKLKNSFFRKYDNKYCQVLISSLISAQVVDKKLNWNDLGQRIIIFGLKSIFDESFVKENPEIYENILKIPTSDQAQIIQEFFEPLEIISNSEKVKPIYSILITAILDGLLKKNMNMEKEKKTVREIIINNNLLPQNQINNNIEILKEIINENLKEEKYFSQNIPFSSISLSKFCLTDLPKTFIFPTKSELEKLSSQFYSKNDNSIEEIILFIRTLLTPLFRQIMPSNIASGKIPCTSGGSLSIQGIKKWICSGFTYTYIFEKQGGKSKKKYNLSFVIDLSQSVLLLCNYSHSLSTIILLLIAPSTVEDNEEIFIDVIINTIDGIKIVDFNSKCSIFQNISKINEIINIINEEVNLSCCPGSCLYAAYQLLLERREDKKIFLITDGFVSDKYEIELVLSLIQKCENEGIDFITIGVGSFPNGLKDIYPNCCYSPSIRTIQDSLLSCFIFSKEKYSKIDSNLFFININEEKLKMLNTIFKKEPCDKKLEESINNEPINIVNMIQNENSNVLDNLVKGIKNPEDEPYYDIFDDYKILVVILYLGDNKHDTNITTEVFEENAGKSLRKKGFKYDIVYSYGEAIEKLLSLENGYCPYSETWIFCSRGNGSLPEKAKDKDSNKITTFLEIVSEYNKNGGALFLFCDNYPYVLEANLLLKEYLKLEEGNVNFQMKGNYNNKNPLERFIYVEGSQKSENGFFTSEQFLKSPGKADRLSLRIGLNKFSEGITLSYAETFDNSENYSPFTPFAYLTDPSKKRPFILYYDPKIKKGDISRGPIVVHGGFTSAFYDFKEDGTGRLVISIACWLIRKEECYMNLREGIEKTIPGIQKPIEKNVIFDKWIKSGNGNMFSIIILDVSGSMIRYYQSLIDMANKIIKKQQENQENEGVVIFFGSYAKAMINGKYRLLNIKDINLAGVGGDTDFYNAFQEAKNYIYNKNNFPNKRILFLTDGIADSSKLKPICDEMIKEKFLINIVGFGDICYFEHLRKFASQNCFYTSTNFKEIETFCQNIFAAE